MGYWLIIAVYIAIFIAVVRLIRPLIQNDIQRKRQMPKEEVEKGQQMRENKDEGERDLGKIEVELAELKIEKLRSDLNNLKTDF